MRRLLHLRSFWCWALVLLLLGGLWVSSRIAPREAKIPSRTEILWLRHQGGLFEVEREVPNIPRGTFRSTSSWTFHPIIPTQPASWFPPPSWQGWHKKKLTPTPGAYHLGSTTLEDWEPIIGSKQRSAALPHWLAILVWLLLGLPLLAWRLRAARRRSAELPSVKA